MFCKGIYGYPPHKQVYNPASMKPPFDLVIFDCDGVLVDSEPFANQVFVQLVRESSNLDLDETVYLKKFYGVTLPNRMKITAEELNWTPPSTFLEDFNSRLKTLTEERLQPIEGIHTLINSIPTPICVASNGTREEIVHRLKISGLTEKFGKSIFSGHEMPQPKPAPDVYLAAARSFGASPSRCIVIEDSIPGVTAGVKAGMKVYGYAAYTPAAELQKIGAIPFSAMNELKKMLAL